MNTELERIKEIIDISGVADIELLLPTGVRPRQLQVTTLLIGMTLAARAGREAFLTDVHTTLTALPEGVQRRLGVIARWADGEHRLTYRQVEYTFDRLTTALAKDTPDGTPSEQLHDVLDRLLEASVQVLGEPACSSYAVDWTDQETWSRPPPKKSADSPEPTTVTATPANDHDATPEDHDPAASTENTTTPPPTPSCADPEGSWGHRRGDAPGQHDETFYGYYLQAATTVNDEHGPPVPELARRMHLSSCDHDPPAAFVPALQRMHATGITITDLLVDSGYSYRVPETWALPLRQLGIDLTHDLHPNDRGPNGTHHGATCSNGRLYCPATPTTLLDITPLPRAASAEQTTIHDQQCAELARYKLSPITSHDPDGYHRASCPAAQGKLRCPHPAAIADPPTRPAHRAHPARAPARVLHPTNDHRAAHREHQNRAETRLPLTRAPRQLQPSHRRRTHLRHPHRPRDQRPLPRLVPTNGPHTNRAAHRHHADRPQHPRGRRVHRPPSREPATRSPRAPTQTPQTPPHHDPRPHRYRPRPLTPDHAARNDEHPTRRHTPTPRGRNTTRPRTQQQQNRAHQTANRPHHHPTTAHAGSVRRKREHPRPSNVKTSKGERGDSNPRPPGPQPGALPTELRPP